MLAVLLAVALHGMRTLRPVPPLPYASDPVGDSPARREAYARLARASGAMRVWPFSPGLQRYALPPKLPTLTHLRSLDDYEPRCREHFTPLAGPPEAR